MRRATTTDLTSITELLDQAFKPSRLESQLVSALVSHGRELHHWLLEEQRQVFAYVCYSRAYRGTEILGWHLAPVAVHPECQGKGLGSDLIRFSLGEPPLSSSPVFVLGHPSFYCRFGFKGVKGSRSPYDPTNEYFMGLRYSSDADFIIGYEKEFGDVFPAV